MEKSTTVVIPFNKRFKEHMLKGRKTWTSRTRPYGKIGYTFQVFSRAFIITDIQQMYLGKIAENYFYEEGFDTPKEFIAFWNILHPKKGYNPKQIIYAHEFKLLTILEETQ